ncbi:hypothetical protein HMPREF1601_02512 [Escherichia coli 907779]|nr:hypothetical protein HMPREF1601_02512 [Escherichia coli 907779]
MFFDIFLVLNVVLFKLTFSSIYLYIDICSFFGFLFCYDFGVF